MTEHIPTKYMTLAVVTLLAMVGCRLPGRFGNDLATPTPVLLPENPTFEDVARVVNANSAAVRQLQVSNATLNSPDIPMALTASFALEKPRRFRLTAESIRGRELDLGSNDEQYWVWMNDRQSAIYYGRHERFYQSAARTILPVPPDWLIEAIGLLEFDPTGQHEGPFHNRPGQLEIRSIIPTPSGELTKITVIDDQHGWVLEQHVYDTNAGNQLLASATATDFNYDPLHGVSLPRTVNVKLPPANIEFSLEIDRHAINQIYADPETLWSLPNRPDVEMIDLERMSNPAPRYVEPQQRFAPTADSRFQQRSQRRRYDEGYVPPRQAMRRLPRSEQAYSYR